MTSERRDTLPIARKPHVGQWVAVGVLALIAAELLRTIVPNEHLQWDKVHAYLFDPIIIEGVWVTLELAVVCQAIGIALGTLIAVMTQYSNPVLKEVARLYVWLFRGTPLLVQLLVWYNLALLFPTVSLSIPFTDVGWSVPTNAVITPWLAAVLGLSLNDGAYMAEVIRGGLLSVPRGQFEAAQSIGMHRGMALKRVIIPQALRVIIPPTGNQFISMIKATSLVSVIGGGELLTNAQGIYAQNFLVIPLLIVVSIWYLVLVSILSIGQFYLERYFERDRRDAAERKNPARFLNNLISWRRR